MRVSSPRLVVYLPWLFSTELTHWIKATTFFHIKHESFRWFESDESSNIPRGTCKNGNGWIVNLRCQASLVGQQFGSIMTQHFGDYPHPQSPFWGVFCPESMAVAEYVCCCGWSFCQLTSKFCSHPTKDCDEITRPFEAMNGHGQEKLLDHPWFPPQESWKNSWTSRNNWMIVPSELRWISTTAHGAKQYNL